MLFTADAYRAIGGHGAIPGSFHDGLQLARRIKAQGGSVALVDGSEYISCRMYRGRSEVWNGFTRNAYEGLGGFPALLFMTAAQVTLFLQPYLVLVYAATEALLYGRVHTWTLW